MAELLGSELMADVLFGPPDEDDMLGPTVTLWVVGFNESKGDGMWCVGETLDSKVGELTIVVVTPDDFEDVVPPVSA